MNVRYLPVETHTAAMNMALDEAAMNAVRTRAAPPTIRLYRWKPSAVSIGYFQCLTDETDKEALEKDGVDVVRRQTGGGAVYHDEHGEITYSIILPEEAVDHDIRGSYEDVLRIIIQGLAKLGIQATFRPLNDLTVEHKKISGSAQTRKGGVFLQHGTILYRVDPATMFRYLTPDKSKISDKPYIKSVQSSVTSITEHNHASREDIEAALLETFQHAYPGTIGSWSEEELDEAHTLATEKYSNDSWNASR